MTGLNRKLRLFLLYWLPLATNVGLIIYLVWQLNLVPYFQRQGEFAIFSVLYAIGGLVVVVSGITAFVHASAMQKTERKYFVLSLINTIIPTLLLLLMLLFR
jgi:hypothetical protein